MKREVEVKTCHTCNHAQPLGKSGDLRKCGLTAFSMYANATCRMWKKKVN